MPLSDILEQYIKFRADPAHDEATDGVFAAQRKIDILAFLKEKAEASGLMERILVLRREKYLEELMEVDRALFQKAKEGDTRAADLIYRRFENWSPKQADEQAKISVGAKNKTFADLIAEG